MAGAAARQTRASNRAISTAAGSTRRRAAAWWMFIDVPPLTRFSLLSSSAGRRATVVHLSSIFRRARERLFRPRRLGNREVGRSGGAKACPRPPPVAGERRARTCLARSHTERDVPPRAPSNASHRSCLRTSMVQQEIGTVISTADRALVLKERAGAGHPPRRRALARRLPATAPLRAPRPPMGQSGRGHRRLRCARCAP